MLPGSWRTGVAFAVICLGFYLIRLSAQGVLTMSSRNAVGKWFDLRRGMAMALSGIFISFGFSVAPKVLDVLINQMDYDGAWRFLAALTLIVMAPLGWLIFRDNPEECGMTMDGPGVKRPKVENPDMVIYREYNRGEAMRTVSFHAFNLSFAFFALYSTAYTFHIESLGAEFGFAKAKIINLFIPIAAISVATSLFFGWFNARTRLKYMLLIMNLGALLGAIGLYRLGSSWGVPAYVIGTGITGGVFFESLRGGLGAILRKEMARCHHRGRDEQHGDRLRDRPLVVRRFQAVDGKLRNDSHRVHLHSGAALPREFPSPTIRKEKNRADESFPVQSIRFQV